MICHTYLHELYLYSNFRVAWMANIFEKSIYIVIKYKSIYIEF